MSNIVVACSLQTVNVIFGTNSPAMMTIIVVWSTIDSIPRSHHPRHPHPHPSTIPSHWLSHNCCNISFSHPLKCSWLSRLPNSSYMSYKSCGIRPTFNKWLHFLPTEYKSSRIQPSYRNNYCIRSKTISRVGGLSPSLSLLACMFHRWSLALVGMYRKQTTTSGGA